MFDILNKFVDAFLLLVGKSPRATLNLFVISIALFLLWWAVILFNRSDDIDATLRAEIIKIRAECDEQKKTFQFRIDTLTEGRYRDRLEASEETRIKLEDAVRQLKRLTQLEKELSRQDKTLRNYEKDTN